MPKATLNQNAEELTKDENLTKLRVIISSDFPPTNVVMRDAPADQCSDPDDIQSMVRFLLYTNEFDCHLCQYSQETKYTGCA